MKIAIKKFFIDYGFFIFLAAFLYQLLWIWQGVDLSDTGWDLAKQWMVFNGGAATQLDMIFGSSFVGGLWNSIVPGNYLIWAYLGPVVLHSFIALILYSILASHFEKKISFFAVLAITPLLLTPIIKVLNYNDIPVFFFLLMIFFINKAYLSERAKLKILYLTTAGIFYSIAVMCKFVLIAFIFFPVVIILYNIFFANSRLQWSKKSLCLVLGAAIGFMAIFLVMNHFGLMKPYLKNIYDGIFSGLIDGNAEAAGLGVQHNARDFLITWSSYYYFVFLTIPLVFIFLIISAYILKIKNKVIRNVTIGIYITLVVVFIFRYLNVYKFYNNIYFIIFGLNFFIIISFLIKSKIRSTNLLLLLALFGQVIINIGSLVMNWTNMYLTTSISIVLLFKMAEDKETFTFIPVNKLVDFRKVLVIILIIFGMSVNMFIMYRDVDIFPNRFKLTNSFAAENMKYIYTSAERVEQIDGIVQKIKEYTKPGDRIFCVNSIPMIYYLSETGPVTSDPWAIRLQTYDTFKNEVTEIFESNPPSIVVFSKKVTDEEKADVVWDFLGRLGYVLDYENSGFVLYKLN